MTNPESMELARGFIKAEALRFELFAEVSGHDPEVARTTVLENLETLAEGGQLPGGL